MPWIEIHPERPTEGDTLTFKLKPGYLETEPSLLLLESDRERVNIPLHDGTAQITLVKAGHYTLHSNDHRFSFELLGRKNVPVENELLLTMGLVLVGLGGIVRWTQKRRAGSTFRSGGS